MCTFCTSADYFSCTEGAGLGNAFLSHIAAVDGLYHVVRAFDNPEVVHVDDSVVSIFVFCRLLDFTFIAHD